MTDVREPLQRLAPLVIAIGLSLSGCGREDPATTLASAREYQAKGDHQAAIIQFRNAIQQQPNNGEARLQLGRSALVVGDVPTAEKEFRKAFELGEPDAVVVPLIASSMLLGGAADKVIADFAGTKLDDSSADAELRAIVGEAQLQAKKPSSAAESFKAALARDPGSVRARLGLARLLENEGRGAEALKAVEAVAAAHPESVDALLLTAQLKQSLSDKAGARAALKRAVGASPAIVGPRMHLIALLIEDRLFDEAQTEVSAARAARAPDLALQFFEARIAFGQNDRARARDLALKVVKRSPGHVPALVLLGTLEYQEKNYAQAETHLRTAVTLAPDEPGPRAQLARSYLASGQPQRAMDTLRPNMTSFESTARSDPGMALLVGETYFANGDLRRAARFFELASSDAATQPVARMRLGQIALATGHLGSAVDLLESATVAEAVPVQADMALVTGYVRQGNTDKALEVARAMVKRRPNDPVGHFAVGAVMAVKREFAAARAAFQQALTVDPTFVPAAAALAQTDLGAKEPGKARGRFESVLARDPKNEAALMGLAALMIQTRAPVADIVAVLRRAVDASPRSARARLALVDLHLRAQDSRAGLAAAQEASAAIADNPRIVDALGRAQLAAGDTNQAIETYNRMAALPGQSVVALLRLARIHLALNQLEKAADALLRAQKAAPSNPTVAQGLVAVYLRMGRNDEALKQARALQGALPSAPDGFVLEGNVHRAARQSALAEKAYRQALKVEPNSELAALRLHEALLASNNSAEAGALGDKWLAAHPKAVTFRAYLGEQALRGGDLKRAVVHYQAVVVRQPRNANALNNLAWAMGQLGDPKALDYAERAVKISPRSPEALDTLGVLLTSRGYAVRGVEYLSRAVEIAPDQHAIRLNYAKALLKAGRKDEAGRQLAELERIESDFPGKSELAGLLKQ